jgi:hypothetical protein
LTGRVRGRYDGGLNRRSNPQSNPFRYFSSSPEVIRLVVMLYVRYPLSLRKAEDLRFERGFSRWKEDFEVEGGKRLFSGIPSGQRSNCVSALTQFLQKIAD